MFIILNSMFMPIMGMNIEFSIMNMGMGMSMSTSLRKSRSMMMDHCKDNGV